MTSTKRYFGLFALWTLVSTCSALVSAPYQVSIRLYDNFNAAGSFSLCNGAIIHPMYILTTADCCRTQIFSQQMSRPLPASAIYLMTGNFSGGPQNVRHVSEIFTNPDFNGTSYANNIALIKLESPLDLEKNPDLSWLELPDSDTKPNSCITVFNNDSTTNTYPFTAQQSTSVADNWFCQKDNPNFTKEFTNSSICSFYTFRDSFMCKVTENQLKTNKDRGTPLVCNDKLYGLLSMIVPPKNGTNSTQSVCDTTLRTPAFYTRVALYTTWIHRVIGNSLPPSVDGKPQPVMPSSPPFHGPTTTTTTTTTARPSKGTASSIADCSMSLAISMVAAWYLAQRQV